jgi:hypothetical protein
MPDDPPPLQPDTCAWAQDGLKKALEGEIRASIGVSRYDVGTRKMFYKSFAEQQSAVDLWRKRVEFYCGTKALPSALTGRDTARRIVLRDI